MKNFTGWEYMLIDVANHFGKDKMLFEDRIQWATDHLDQLESLADQAESKPLFVKTVMAIRKIQKRQPSGHLVAMDATCSGVQIMSALTGCIKGATATGLVDPNRRADAYSDLNVEMNNILGGGINIPRKDSKAALMTSCYGSQQVPKDIFGDGTPELDAFYQAVETIAPGAWELLQDLLDSWQPNALVHEWKLPDGFDARIKVIVSEKKRIEVDELGGATFTYEYKENAPEKKGRANVANVVHSIDAFILRELIRRCNHNSVTTRYARMVAGDELTARDIGAVRGGVALETSKEFKYYLSLWRATKQVTVAMLPYLDEVSVQVLTRPELLELIRITKEMSEYSPFPVITIHDSFASHPNNVNHVRHWYKEILAELADSDLLSFIFGSLHNCAGTYPKRMQGLSAYIRQSNYALS